MPPFPTRRSTAWPDDAGLDIDLMIELAEKLGATVEFIPYDGSDFNGIFDGLGSEYDCVTAGTTVTPEREQKALVRPALPHLRTVAGRRHHAPAARHDPSTTSTASPSACSRATPASRSPSGSSPRARPRPSASTTTASIRTALTDLTTGACDAFMKLAPVLTELVKPIPGVEVVQRGISVENIAIAVARNDQALLARLTVAQAELEDDGTLQRIRGKWLGNPYADQSLAVH